MKFLMEQIALIFFSSVVQYTSISFFSLAAFHSGLQWIYTIAFLSAIKAGPQDGTGLFSGWTQAAEAHSWALKCFEEHPKIHPHPQITDT